MDAEVAARVAKGEPEATVRHEVRCAHLVAWANPRELAPDMYAERERCDAELSRQREQERMAQLERVHQAELAARARLEQHLHEPAWMQRLLSARACNADSRARADQSELEQQRQGASGGRGQDAVRVAELRQDISRAELLLEAAERRLKEYAMPRLKCRTVEDVARCIDSGICPGDELSEFALAAKVP